jgi:hypothetical protein
MPAELGAELPELDEPPSEPRDTAPPPPPELPPPSLPRLTALPPVDSPPLALRCAHAGVPLTARVAATAPMRTLPRVMDTFL